MVEEKLPKEVTAKKLELQIYEDVVNERNINNQYLSNLQNQVLRYFFHTWKKIVDIFNKLSLGFIFYRLIK